MNEGRPSRREGRTHGKPPPGGDQRRGGAQRRADGSDRGRRGATGRQGGTGGDRRERRSEPDGTGFGPYAKRPRAPGAQGRSGGEQESRRGRPPRRDARRGGDEPAGRRDRDRRDRDGRDRDRDRRDRDRRSEDSPVRAAARGAVARGAASSPPRALRIVRREAEAAEPPRPRRSRAGTPRTRAPVRAAPTTPARDSARVHDAVQRAARALEREYEREALRILRPLRERHPASPDVRELLGVAHYRLGQWRAAQKELEAFAELTGSTSEHPLLMDCARALGRHRRVETLWEELRAASPASDVVTEGRIVAAGSLADQGHLREAIKLLERGPIAPKQAADHHLRLWYALADLHERAGDLPAARSLFRKVSSKDPSFVDVSERLAALS